MKDSPPPTMVCAGFDWDHPSPLRHLELELCRHYRVLHLESIGLRRPTLALRDLRRAASKGARWLAGGAKAVGGHAPTLIAPMVLPLPGSAAVRSLNASALCRQLVRAVGPGALTPDLFLTALPTAVDLLSRLRPRVSAYYRVDDWPRWPGIDGDLVGLLEARLMDQVDVTVCTSTALLERARDRHGAASLLPQGVDIEHFGAAMSPGPVHPVAANLPGPVAGFFGLLDDRLDRELLRVFLRSWPGTVVLAGRRHGRWNIPGARLRLPGWIPYEELPDLARGVDVWVLPYRVGPRTNAIDPLKLREYLATGRPVVSTALPEVEPWRPHVAVARDAESFVAAAVAAAADPGRGRRARLATLGGHTWTDRCDAFLQRVGAAACEGAH